MATLGEKPRNIRVGILLPQYRCLSTVERVQLHLSHEEEKKERRGLVAQGFTQDEAVGLIHVSDRLKTSREARESDAVLGRLRFTRWLINQGKLDEWTV